VVSPSSGFQLEDSPAETCGFKFSIFAPYVTDTFALGNHFGQELVIVAVYKNFPDSKPIATGFAFTPIHITAHGK
jgi:hypothetical protein